MGPASGNARRNPSGNADWNAPGNAGQRPVAGVALAVTGLSVAYGNVVAVHDATFAVAEGDACAITGPNGNGKSSILMGVTGMVRRRGDGGDLRRAGQERRRPVGGPARAHAGAGAPPALPGPDHGGQHHARLLHVDEQHLRKARKSGLVRARDRPLPRAQAAPASSWRAPSRAASSRWWRSRAGSPPTPRSSPSTSRASGSPRRSPSGCTTRWRRSTSREPR